MCQSVNMIRLKSHDLCAWLAIGGDRCVLNYSLVRSMTMIKRGPVFHFLTLQEEELQSHDSKHRKESNHLTCLFIRSADYTLILCSCHWVDTSCCFRLSGPPVNTASEELTDSPLTSCLCPSARPSGPSEGVHQVSDGNRETFGNSPDQRAEDTAAHLRDVTAQPQAACSSVAANRRLRPSRGPSAAHTGRRLEL